MSVKTTTLANGQTVNHKQPNRAGMLLSVGAWIVGLLFVSPVLWMILTSFHSEPDAATNPPSFTAPLTLAGYRSFFESGPWPSIINSVMASVVSTVLVLVLAFPNGVVGFIHDKWFREREAA